MRTRKFRARLSALLLAATAITTLGQSKGFDPANMDRAAEACTDFFQYANGTWLKNTEIPASEARWGTFNMLADNNNALLHKVLEDAAKTKSAKGSNEQLVGDLYATCIDEAAIDKAGLEPIKKYLARIGSI